MQIIQNLILFTYLIELRLFRTFLIFRINNIDQKRMKKNNTIYRPVQNNLRLDRTRSKDLQKGTVNPIITKSLKKQMEENKKEAMKKIITTQKPKESRETKDVQEIQGIENVLIFKPRRISVQKTLSPSNFRTLIRSNSMLLKPKRLSNYNKLSLDGRIDTNIMYILSEQLLKYLVDNGQLCQRDNIIEIEKTKFIQMFESIINHLANKTSQQESKSFKFLEPILDKMTLYMRNVRNKQKKTKMTINKKEVSYTYSSANYNCEILKQSSKILQMSTQLSLLENKKANIDEYYDNLLRLSEEKQSEVEILSKMVYQHRDLNVELQQRHISLIKDIAQQQAFLSKISDKVHKVKNFSDSQCYKLDSRTEMVSNYKKVEDEMCRYVSSLHINSLKAKRVPSEQIVDEIVKFMSSWAVQSENKKHYLKSLRQQFVFYYDRIVQTMNELFSWQLTEVQTNKLKAFRKLIENLSINYKFGNSFY